VLGRKDFTFQE